MISGDDEDLRDHLETMFFTKSLEGTDERFFTLRLG
jgi:hypothetical protein